MNTKLLLSVFLLSLFSFSASAQNSSFGERFSEAVRLETEGEKNRAFEIWTSLARDYPSNGNVQYRAGVAHLESFNQKKAALPYLELAEQLGVNDNYDPTSQFEEGAPLTVYFYLAKAYHLNYQLDDAEQYYAKFMESTAPKHYLYDDSDLGIRQVGNARILIADPVEFSIQSMGQTINTQYPDYSPVISIDENALFFTSQRLRKDSSNIDIINQNTGGYFDDIYVSYRNRLGEWQEPEILNLNSEGPAATMNVSPNGQVLYVYGAEDEGSIMESTLVGETWTTPQKMDAPINLPNSWETHVAVTSDGETVYFISNRKGGSGGRDIWRVKKLPTGEWSEAYNMGPVLNTPFEEEAVFISPDEKTLYFSSQGHNSMGGFDVFRSDIDESGNWTEPVNIGYPINTVDDDVFFVTSADGRRAYFSSFREEGMGEKDIYVIDLPEPREVKLALLKGFIIPAPGETLPDDITVSVTNMGTGENSVFSPRQRDGVFVAILPPCFDYEVEYFVGVESLGTDSFNIDCESAYQEIEKVLLLNPVLLSDDGKTAIISSKGGTSQPAEFKKLFGYNENSVQLEEEIYNKFLGNVKKLIAEKGEVEVIIEGSASKVPTRTFGNNRKLADLRAENARKRLMKSARDFGIDVEKLNIVEVKGMVQGPEYKGDYKTGIDKYREYQYVKLTVK